MAKTKAKLVVIEVLTLNYQLAKLPSSQHRAGLAGVALIYRWLKEEPHFKEKLAGGMICQLTESSEGATLEINQAGLEALFDEIYAASAESTRETKIRVKKGEEIKPAEIIEEDVIDKKTNQPKTDKTTGEIQKKKIYCYPVAIPKGSFLADAQYDKSSDGKDGIWIKLWRDVVWSILRGVSTTRTPFEARAEGEYKQDAIKVWQELIKPETFAVDLPSTYFLGAQSANAETVPFKDRARYQLLLHFWLFASQIYVPQVFKIDRGKESKEVGEKREFVGYAIAIPDVANLKRFCDKFLKLLKERGVEKSGYRPRDAVVDLAVESALDMMSRLSDRLIAKTGEQSIASTILGVDVIHTEKEGQNVRVRSFSRIEPDEPTIDKYNQIKTSCWNPLFRRQRLINLVKNRPWYMGFDALLCTIPYEQSIENDYFQHDVKIAFDTEVKQMNESGNEQGIKDVDRLVFDLVKNYVSRKLSIKYDLKWSEVKERPDDKKKYEDTKEKVAKDAFLAVRSRTEQSDFVNYFVSTLCSVPQYLKSEEYVVLTKALYDETDRIRTLTLLALSANS